MHALYHCLCHGYAWQRSRKMAHCISLLYLGQNTNSTTGVDKNFFVQSSLITICVAVHAGLESACVVGLVYRNMI